MHRPLIRCAGVLLALLPLTAIGAPPPGLDARIEAAMREHEVPGVALAIVENGEVVLSRGYGVRQLGNSEPVDADTLFPTGSTGKAVTAVALAILVDEGKLDWDDRVIDHLPAFRMHDPWVTREMTVRDLLVHRSGLGLGAGDLLFVPRTSRSRADVLAALEHIVPATSFRSRYAYDNILYVVAGEVVAAASGMSWERFIRERVFVAAGMQHAVSDESDRFTNPNRAQPHARVDGRLRGLGRQQLLNEREGLGQTAAPAGGLSASASDQARWLQIQLGLGALPGGSGKRLYSEAVAREMWTPQIPMPIRSMPAPIAEMTPQFSSYALGWNVQDYRGTRIVLHGGAVFGVLTLVVLAPEQGIGFSIQANAEEVVVLRGLMYELLDHYLDAPAPRKDWFADFAAWNRARLDAGLAALESSNSERRRSSPSLKLEDYAGRYADAWYGPITLHHAKGQLRLDFTRSPGMVGTLTHHQFDTFRVDWDDRAIESAYLTFALDAAGRVERISMKAVSPLADFSYDYHDLRIVPLAE
jgi:CubicO group peptidase (beta-lactamase class C family)